MNETLQTHWSDCWREPGHHACAIRRIEQLETELAKRDEPCVWKYKRYGGWFTSCGVTPESWNAPWKFCPQCSHPVLVEPSDNDSSSPG